jgi:hypothetical protein
MTREAFSNAVADALALVDYAVAKVVHRDDDVAAATGDLQKRILVVLHMIDVTPRLKAAADELYDAAYAYADARRSGAPNHESRAPRPRRRGDLE